MTTNQLAYWNLQESKRANRAKEANASATLRETQRSNMSKEQETYRSNVAKEQETKRSNLATEILKRGANQEQARHNQTQENQAILDLIERIRSAKAGESISFSKLAQDLRLNQEKLAEQERHNLATEAVQAIDVQTKKDLADTKLALDWLELIIPWIDN